MSTCFILIVLCPLAFFNCKESNSKNIRPCTNNIWITFIGNSPIRTKWRYRYTLVTSFHRADITSFLPSDVFEFLHLRLRPNNQLNIIKLNYWELIIIIIYKLILLYIKIYIKKEVAISIFPFLLIKMYNIENNTVLNLIPYRYPKVQLIR